MFGLIVYGSLIHKEEIYKYDCSINQILPAHIHGFKRSFNLLPCVRKGIGNYKSVLNIEHSPDNFFNGLCILYEKLDISLIDKREKGYNRVRVNTKAIKTYGNIEIPNDIKVYTYTGLNNKIDTTIMPNVEYLKLCLNGSRQWGDKFHQDFVQTTHMNNNHTLENFIRSDFTL